MIHSFVRALVPASVLASVLAAGLLVGAAAHAQNASGAQIQALRTACGADAKKLCANVQPGGGRLLQCLRQHQGDLSPACKDGLAGLAAAAPKQ